jgi:hypothetical protein
MDLFVIYSISTSQFLTDTKKELWDGFWISTTDPAKDVYDNTGFPVHPHEMECYLEGDTSEEALQHASFPTLELARDYALELAQKLANEDQEDCTLSVCRMVLKKEETYLDGAKIDEKTYARITFVGEAHREYDPKPAHAKKNEAEEELEALIKTCAVTSDHTHKSPSQLAEDIIVAIRSSELKVTYK